MLLEPPQKCVPHPLFELMVLPMMVLEEVYKMTPSYPFFVIILFNTVTLSARIEIPSPLLLKIMLFDIVELEACRLIP